MRVGLPILLLWLASVVHAGDVLAQARDLATSSHRAEALRLLEERLTEHPADVDARLYYGTVLSWEGRYDEARRELRRVLADHPNYTSAKVALVRLEVWADRTDQALELYHELLKSDPQSSELRTMRDVFRTERQAWKATFDYANERFSGGSAWGEYQLSLRRTTPLGSVIARWSRAERFGMHSNHGEIEMYPRIRPGTYGWLSEGFSVDRTLYPRFRLGAELFQSLGHGFEVSGGLRRIVFSSPTTIYTGSVTRYRGNWMWTGRFYLTPDAAGASKSIQVTARRYFGKRDYWAVRFSRGAAPVEQNSTLDMLVLSSTSVSLELNKTCLKDVDCGLHLGYGREDRTYGRYNHFTAESFVALRF